MVMVCDWEGNPRFVIVLTSFSTSVCVRPAVTNCPYHATGSARTAVGRFLLLARLSGTPCPKTFGIWSVALTVTDSHWRHLYFRSTCVFSALEVFTWMRYINLRLTLTLAMLYRLSIPIPFYRLKVYEREIRSIWHGMYRVINSHLLASYLWW